MPLRNEPPSLRRAAMVVICEYFEPLCYGLSSEEVANMIDTEEYLDIKGPFEDMPGPVLACVAEAVSERRALHRKHLHMLVQPQTPRLNLSWGDADGYHGIQFAGQRCKACSLSSSSPPPACRLSAAATIGCLLPRNREAPGEIRLQSDSPDIIV
ncbi:uncharacterized protein LOC113215750 [Frankliniella occidentalis]|uniref:Uncharacterized protein LOC113215750 n=1 Tax=Frankliniella occidentalis TaxID=133901 RepID=A0A9C6X216_FRAOC|nr:uncharacterized protein LOC113215750 [Frankliniella occidentalis]